MIETLFTLFPVTSQRRYGISRDSVYASQLWQFQVEPSNPVKTRSAQCRIPGTPPQKSAQPGVFAAAQRRAFFFHTTSITCICWSCDSIGHRTFHRRPSPGKRAGLERITELYNFLECPNSYTNTRMRSEGLKAYFIHRLTRPHLTPIQNTHIWGCIGILS